MDSIILRSAKKNPAAALEWDATVEVEALRVQDGVPAVIRIKISGANQTIWLDLSNDEAKRLIADLSERV